MTKKVLIIGDAGVGKTSLRTQFFHKTFTFSYRATIGANFLTKNVILESSALHEPVDSVYEDALSTPAKRNTEDTHDARQDGRLSNQESEVVPLCVWDTAGQERFNSLSPTFFRGSDAAILLYDVTNPTSLSHLSTHHRDFTTYCGTRHPVIFVVGNKCDAAGRRVSLGDARRMVVQELCDEDGSIECYEVSAKLGTSVEDLFLTLARRLKARDERREWMAFDVDGEDGYDDGGGGGGAAGGSRLVDLQKRIKSSSRCAC